MFDMTKMSEGSAPPGCGGEGNVVVGGAVVDGGSIQPDVTSLPQLKKRRRRANGKRKIRPPPDASVNKTPSDGGVHLPPIAPSTLAREERIHNYLQAKSTPSSSEPANPTTQRKSFIVNLGILMGHDPWPNTSQTQEGDGDEDCSHISPGDTIMPASPGTRRDATGTHAVKQWDTLTPRKMVGIEAAAQRKTRHGRSKQHSLLRRLLPARLSSVLLSPAVVNVARDVGDTLLGSCDVRCLQAGRAREKLYRLSCYWMCRFGDSWQMARDMCRHLTVMYDDSREWRELRMLTTLADRDMDSEAPAGARERYFWRVYGPRIWNLAEQLDRTVSYLDRCHAEGRQPMDLPFTTDAPDAEFDDSIGSEGSDGNRGEYAGIGAGEDDSGKACAWRKTRSPNVPRLLPIARGRNPKRLGQDDPPLGPLTRKATLHTANTCRCTRVELPPAVRSLKRKYVSKVFRCQTPLPPRCTPDDDYAFQIYGTTTPLINTINLPSVSRCVLLPRSFLR